MGRYIDIFVNGYKSYAGYVWNEITHPHWHNYFYWLIAVSAFFFGLEMLRPWRRQQPIIRKDFWLDFFYMFFNFFLFSLIIYNAASDVVVNLLNDGIKAVTGGFDLFANNPLVSLPLAAVLLIGFVLRDFIQWWIHRLLHFSPRLWEFHKVHHSVEQMGFAAHLRYHWMENIVYRTIEYLPLALIVGMRLDQFFIIHIFTLAWGHYNHANFHINPRILGTIVLGGIGLLMINNMIDFTLFTETTMGIKTLFIASMLLLGYFALGPLMPKLFNSPEMHIWHHAYNLPEGRKHGINFGITLALWDYLFGTAEIPYDGRDIKLGYPNVEEMPHTFIGQSTYGI